MKTILIIVLCLLCAACAWTYKTKAGDFSIVLTPGDIQQIVDYATRRSRAEGQKPDLRIVTESGHAILLKAGK